MQAGVEIEEGFNEIFNDQILEVWPHVLWIPRWAITFSDVQKKVGSAYKSSFISKKSTLLLHGEDIEIDNIHLEGTLVIHAIHGALVRYKISSLYTLTCNFLDRFGLSDH